ncbi:PepSY domain-containing protein [Simiduia litorea]|uniref:PepSY domain-containing protein n=1 Tax=Simiduia litorea TaxID=1435348 RepID=UPI0036F2CA06
MLRKYWRPILWRWHKRLGLTLILLLLWLSVTGLMLNHTDDLALAERPLAYGVLLQLYGISETPVTSYQLPNQAFLSQAGDHLYFQGQRVSHCGTDQFSMVAVDEALFLAACGRELLMITDAGELVERIGASYDLPQPITALGLCDAKPCLQNGTAAFYIDVDGLTWQPAASDFTASVAAPLPENILSAIEAQWVSAEVNWERLMLDLHAGRTFGLGPWLMDAVALLIIVLSMTGFGIWLAGRKRRKD